MNVSSICDHCLNNDICKYVPVMKNVTELCESKINGSLNQHIRPGDPISLTLECKRFRSVELRDTKKKNWWDEAPVKPSSIE